MEFIRSVLDQLKGQTGWGPLVEVFLVVLLTVAASIVSKRLIRRIKRQFEKTENPWDDAIIAAIERPAAVLIWVVGISFAAYLVGEASQVTVFDAVVPLMSVAIIAISTWFVIRLIKNVETLLVDRDVTTVPTWDPTTAKAIGKLIRLSVIITATLVGMQSLGLNVSGALAFGGIGGLAVGMAAKDLLANFFGGLMLYLDRPIAVGEWVRSPDKAIEGTVEEIGWRLTRIRTFDKRPLFIPNSLFTTMIVENPSRMTHRRIYETIGIRYDDVGAMDRIVADVEAMLQAHDAIDTTQTLMVHFNAFGPSSLDFFLYCMTKTTDWAEYHTVKHDVLTRIYVIIQGYGADMAFPTSTVHLPDAVEVQGALPRAV